MWYTSANVLLSNGILRLKAQDVTQHVNGRTIPYSSGMLSTGGGPDGSKPRFTAKYGYFEIRARIPSGNGLWPAFWMLTPDQKPPEIDIMEVLSRDTNTVQMHYHYLDDSGTEQDVGQGWWSEDDFSEGWHTYAVEWRPDAIIWYVDGVERNRYEGDAIADVPLYLILNLQVGNADSWAGPTDKSTKFPAYFDIDYVRVWQRPKS